MRGFHPIVCPATWTITTKQKIPIIKSSFSPPIASNVMARTPILGKMPILPIPVFPSEDSTKSSIARIATSMASTKVYQPNVYPVIWMTTTGQQAPIIKMPDFPLTVSSVMEQTQTPGKMRHSTTTLYGLCLGGTPTLTAPVATIKGMTCRGIAMAVMHRTMIQPETQTIYQLAFPQTVNSVIYHPMYLGPKRSSTINSPSIPESTANGIAPTATSHPITESFHA